MTIPAAILLALCFGAVCFVLGAATVLVIAPTMRSSHITRRQENTPTPLPWWAHIPGHWPPG